MEDGLITSTTNLSVPMVTGQVSISLAELDNLRQAAANALTAAQTLESQQRLVKVVVEKKYTGYEEDRVKIGTDNYGQPRYNYVESKSPGQHIVSMEVVNLGDIMPDLVDKATDDVKAAWDAEVQGLKNSNKTLEGTLEARTDSLKSKSDDNSRLAQELHAANDDISDLRKELDETSKSLSKLENREKYFWKPMQNKYTKLIDNFNKLNTRKTLWGWLQNKIIEEGQPVKGDREV